MLLSIASRIMPRTTLDLDPSVLRELKRRAREEHKSLGEVVSEIMGPVLSQRPAKTTIRFRWRTAPMGPARLDLEDKEAVRRALARP
jgi:hypothetical protein